MAIPSGSGTEVLKRNYIVANSDAWTSLITGVANHVYTVLSVTASEQTNNTEQIYIRVNISAGGTDIYLLTNDALAGYSTFVWNDKFVMSGTDKLEIYNTPGNVDWYVSYIDQDWT
tara:strand:+ start:326 stop:673 length:348 start_codon:yes stop_codon:yes gene_type:complete